MYVEDNFFLNHPLSLPTKKVLADSLFTVFLPQNEVPYPSFSTKNCCNDLKNKWLDRFVYLFICLFE